MHNKSQTYKKYQKLRYADPHEITAEVKNISNFKIMKKGIIYPKSDITVKNDRMTEGESIEQMLRRMRTSKEPIQANAKILYTERDQGVLPWFDIRTDRFEQALMAADRVHASKAAARQAEIDAAKEQIAADMTAAAKTGKETAGEA